MSEFVFKNIIQETFPEPYVELEYIAFADDHTVIIVFKQGKGKMERFKSCCHLLLEKLCDHIVDSGNCYYITGVSLIDAQDCMEKLEEISIDDLLNNRAVINYIDFIKPDMGQLTEEFFKLEKNITAQNFQLLSQYVQTYFTAQENRNSISGQLLREMRFNIIQISLCVLKEKGINAYKIFGSPEYDQLFNRALKSLSDMKKFTQYIVDQTLQCLKESAQSQTSAGKVKKYIDKNFNKNITRNDLEKVAFTNLNMLSKDFKIETGYSLHGYIIERRINRAKELFGRRRKVCFGNFIRCRLR